MTFTIPHFYNLFIEDVYAVNVLLRLRVMQQNVGDDLSLYVLKLLPQVSTLPSLVAISMMKVEI